MRGHDITPIGITNFRSTDLPFGIRDKDRLRHIYVIGKSGTGKSTLLMNMAISDINRGNGLCVIDPHGDIAQGLLKYIPQERKKDLIYFDTTEQINPIAFNPLYKIPVRYHHLVAGGLVGAIKKIWPDSWGPRMEHIFKYAILTLLEFPEATLLDIRSLLTDELFREHVLTYVTQDHVRAFWVKEFQGYSSRLKAEAVAPILNKVGLFSISGPLRRIVGQKTRGLRLQYIMDHGKILICNLSKGEIGEEASSLLGSILLSSIQLAALYRATQLEEARKPFYLYIDEMHSFTSLSFADILAEARKYGLPLFLTHQYIKQLDERVQAAIFGNVGTIISFRIGAYDAKIIADEFYPVFGIEDLVNLPRYNIYIKLMIDGTTSAPFSAFTMRKE